MRLAIFDLDGTLLTGDSDCDWMEFLIDEGVLDRAAASAALADVSARYKAGAISPGEFSRFFIGLLKGHAPARLHDWHVRYMQKKILPKLRARGREAVARHRAQGDLLLLSTATNRFLTTPIAAELGFEHLIATEPEVKDGLYTGDFTGVANMREGKVARLEDWLAARGEGLAAYSEVWFYSDSCNDIPLLSRATHPVVVDPDDRLDAHARASGWPVVSLA